MREGYVRLQHPPWAEVPIRETFFMRTKARLPGFSFQGFVAKSVIVVIYFGILDDLHSNLGATPGNNKAVLLDLTFVHLPGEHPVLLVAPQAGCHTKTPVSGCPNHCVQAERRRIPVKEMGD